MGIIFAWFKATCIRLKNILRPGEKADISNKIADSINEQLVFAPSKHLTLGVELELGIVDPVTHKPVHNAQLLIDALHMPKVHQEAAAHILEITTGICANVREVEKDLSESIALANKCAAENGMALCGTGRVALLHDEELQLYKNERYDFLRQRRQVLYNRFNSMQGMHIHLGMRSAEDCIRYHNFFVHFLPHILALSASSPIENRVNTGLASYRTVAAEALPITGLPYQFNNWREYESLCHAMESAGSICSLKDLNWDLRPCPRFGTLEIRIADMPATLAGCMAVVAFVHCLAHWYEEHHGWLDEMPRPSNWRMRDNKWRAMRYGLGAQIVVNNSGETRDISTDILLWLKRMEGIVTHYKYEAYIDTLKQILLRGNSSDRQQRILYATGNVGAVAKFNMDEWQAGTPLWDEVEATQNESQHRKASDLHIAN